MVRSRRASSSRDADELARGQRERGDRRAAHRRSAASSRSARLAPRRARESARGRGGRRPGLADRVGVRSSLRPDRDHRGVRGRARVWLVARAEKLARERSQFAAAAAHELRTPLAASSSTATCSPMARRSGQAARLRAADERGGVAPRPCRVQRPRVLAARARHLSVDPKVARLDEELRRLCDRAERRSIAPGPRLALDVSPELTAKFDRGRARRGCWHLLDNAEKYGRDAETARSGCRRVRTATRRGDHLRPRPGITPQARTRLFRPFTRACRRWARGLVSASRCRSRSRARWAASSSTARSPVRAAFVLRSHA